MLDFEGNLQLQLLLKPHAELLSILEQVPQEKKLFLLQIINTYGQPLILTAMQSVLENIQRYSALTEKMGRYPNTDILIFFHKELRQIHQDLNLSFKRLQNVLRNVQEIQQISWKDQTNVPLISNEVLQQTNSSNQLPPSVNWATDSAPPTSPFNSAAVNLNSPTPFWARGSPTPFDPPFDWRTNSAFLTPAFHEDACAPNITLAKI